MTDTIWVLLILYVAFSLPQGLFLMSSFMESIPVELEEEAVMDGCGIYRIVFRIITPVLILICAVLLFYNYNKDLESRLENDRSSVNALAESIFVLQSDIKDFSTYFCINEEVHALLTAKNAEELNKNAKRCLEEAPMQIVQDMVALKGHIKTIGIYPEKRGAPLSALYGCQRLRAGPGDR